jgi:hypothetical protein
VDGTSEIGGLEGFLQVKGELITDHILHEGCNTHIASLDQIFKSDFITLID